MRFLAIGCLVFLSGCFIPTKWNREPDSTHWTGILIQSPIEFGTFDDYTLPPPWCGPPGIRFTRQLQASAQMMARREAAEAQRQAEEPDPNGESIEQAGFVESNNR